MLSKIKKLFTDNRLKDLLGGNMVVNEGVINEFLRLNILPPQLSSIRLRCKKDELGIEAEGAFRDLEFKVEAWIRLLSVRITSKEQMVKVMPSGTTHVKTENANARITLSPGEGLLKEIRSLAEYLPAELSAALEIEDDGVTLLLHKLPYWSREFKRIIKQIPLFSDLKLNPLDYVVIHDLRIEEKAVRIIAGRS